MRVMRAPVKATLLLAILAVTGLGWQVKTELDRFGPWGIEEERTIIDAFPGTASRENGLLILHIQNGAKVELRDRENDLPSPPWLRKLAEGAYRLLTGHDVVPVTYRYEGLVASGHFLLVSAVYYGEEPGYLLIDRTRGIQWHLGDRPNFSPDEHHFVVARCNEMEGFSGVQLWQVQREANGKLFFVYELERHSQTCYMSVSWSGNENVEMTSEIQGIASSDDDFPLYRRTDTYTYDKLYREWVFTPGKPELIQPAQ